MIKRFMIASAVAALMSAPAMAADKGANLGDIDPGVGKTAQIQHFARGTGGIVNNAPTEVYSTSAKAFVDTILFSITPVTSPATNAGIGSSFFTFQILSQGTKLLKNISNGALNLVNLTTGQTIFNNLALTQAQTTSIPFTTGNYRARVSGNASGANGGDYQISFSSPVAPVPEPAVVGSMAAGLAMAGFFATRRRRKLARAA